jgi:hypothetical protein
MKLIDGFLKKENLSTKWNRPEEGLSGLRVSVFLKNKQLSHKTTK